MNKRMDMAQALGQVRHGDTIGIGGMTLYRKPMAFVRGLVRRELRDLTVVGMCSGFEAELLAAAGSLGTLRTCYFGLEFLGLAPLLRKAVEQGLVKVVEETEYTIAVGLQAALMRVPYLPSRDCEVGTDFFRIRPDLRRAPCPVTGEELTWFPALAPRVAIIHAPMADEQGHTWLGGQHCVDAQLAMAADYTIVTAEKIVPTAQIKAAQGGAGLVSFMVDAVVEAPGGAHPTSCYPDYPLDVVHLTNYLRQARGGGAPQYLAQHVHGPAGLPDYLKSIVETSRDPA
ncbi:CoA transferase subunit A [Ramlibacter sp. PS4R-6]|uniref:CoA transferase subunit A n=1 Tax=Ramlibacter sp. PS4R-6 TaxID=3133438 RepID=UPI003099B0A6